MKGDEKAFKAIQKARIVQLKAPHHCIHVYIKQELCWMTYFNQSQYVIQHETIEDAPSFSCGDEAPPP